MRCCSRLAPLAIRGSRAYVARHSRANAGEHLALSELPLNTHGKRVLVADGASLAFYLLGPRRRGNDNTPLVSAWHLGGEYRDLAARTRCVAPRAAPHAAAPPGSTAAKSDTAAFARGVVCVLTARRRAQALRGGLARGGRVADVRV